MARRPFLSDEEILTRARSVFVERGYAASTRQIVAAVGLTWGAIAVRFGSNRGLFTHAMAGPDEPAREQLPRFAAPAGTMLRKPRAAPIPYRAAASRNPNH
jgi:AcrR family transcriptional regulator